MTTHSGAAHNFTFREPYEGWRREAACRRMPPETFFPTVTPSQASLLVKLEAEAKEVCSYCPVRAICLQFAEAARMEYGIYGGLTANERAEARKGAKRKGVAA